VTVRDRKAVLTGGAVIVAALLALRVLPVLARAAVHADGELHARVDLVARSRAELGELERLRDSAAALSHAIVALAPHLVAGASPSDAVAAVAAELSLAANHYHLKLVATTPVDADTIAGRLHRVRMHAQLEGDVRGLSELVRGLEASDPVLVVRDLRVTAPAPTIDSYGPEVLAIEITVEGWYLQ